MIKENKQAFKTWEQEREDDARKTYPSSNKFEELAEEIGRTEASQVEEDSRSKDEIRAEMNRLVTEIEMEQRVAQNVEDASQGTLQEMLNQPYVAPSLTYEKKSCLPKESAYIQKASVMRRPHTAKPPTELVKKALKAQNDRHQWKLQDKDDKIQRQQKVMMK
mmetsp:Transcript_24008/g.36900  ORF Transcript_24008/g.36900 Transcript_24008/m.36900 type:complete len:163 (-) Transcript_24008:1707-2195(-)